MKNFKSLFIGLLIGALIFGGIPTIAEMISYTAYKADFPILIDGEIKELENPAVTIDGRAYLPLRELGNILNVEVGWNEEKGQVEISKTDIKEGGNTDMDVGGNNTDNQEGEVIIIDEHNIEIDGVRYIKEGFIGKTILSKGLGIDSEIEQDEGGNFYEMLPIWLGEDKESGIRIRRYDFKDLPAGYNAYYFLYSDYENILLPFLESIE
ncbi:MAG TPA: copper amine oxidase N-terminal domain-containing protein [Clostridiaceae bacterium]|nr:copper amine oxidase N-terminal domain-containing protein [Clostridiaceae bacterium]